MQDHNLPIYKLDEDEPGMKDYTGGAVPLLGQTVFWYKPRNMKFKKVVRVVISNSKQREILLSWKLLRKWNSIFSCFPYPPKKLLKKRNMQMKMTLTVCGFHSLLKSIASEKTTA